MRYFIALSLLLITGFGCSEIPFLASEVPAEDIEIRDGSTLVLVEKNVGLPMLPGKKGQETKLQIVRYSPGQSAIVHWSRLEQQETAASIAARAEARKQIAAGQDVAIPEPMYEDVAVQGEENGDGLDDAKRISLPSTWKSRDTSQDSLIDADLFRDDSLIWLSAAQYQELIDAGQTEIQLSVIDAGLQDAADLAAKAQEFLKKLAGSNGAPVEAKDVTRAELVSSGDYTLSYNGKKVSVPTIIVENSFATFTVLADQENPLVLEVDLKAWSYGSEVLETFNIDANLSGYSIASINTRAAVAE